MLLAAGAVRSLDRQQLLGVALIGLDVLQDRTFKIARFVAGRLRVKDQAAAQDMVDRMRRDMPYDRGDLYNGTRYWEDEGEYVVQASGVRVAGNGNEQADHAGFVEHGTQPGVRGRKTVAGADYFASTAGLGDGSYRPTGRRRLQYRSHPGTPAQPFFYDNARAVLEERGLDAEEILGDAIAEDD
jgi:hypothetical protein